MFGRWSGAAALAALLLVPVGVDARVRRVPRAAAATEPTIAGFGAFTPAAADPRVAAAFARNGFGTSNFLAGSFRFTPSAVGTSHRAVTVAVRARVVGRQEAAKALALNSDQIAPSAYSLGASIGWKRFALSGDVARVDAGILPLGHESADVGLSFTGKRWATRVDVAADRSLNEQPAFGIDQSWSVGLGGSYALTRNLDVNGGVRYKAQREQFYSLTDDRRDGQAVYLGTTFKF